MELIMAPSSILVTSGAAKLLNLFEHLEKAKIPFKKKAVAFVLHPRNSNRRDYFSKQTFRVMQNGRTLCLLTAGRNLKDLYERSTTFSKACPEIACAPIFFQHREGLDFIAARYFEGDSLQNLVRQGKMTPIEAVGHANDIMGRLEMTFRVSTINEAHNELEKFFASVRGCSFFGGLDRNFLESIVFPFVQQGALEGVMRTRWSNGDFIARNILADAAGDKRLIDYEFARRTHFFGEDFWRWKNFSELPDEAKTLARLKDKDKPWLEGFFILRQILLSHLINGAAAAADDTRRQVGRLLQLAAEANLNFKASVFYNRLGPDSDLAETLRQANDEIVRRGEWGMKLDGETARLREQLTAAGSERDQLRHQVGALQHRLDELNQEVTRREESRLKLDAQLAELRRTLAEREATFAASNVEFARLLEQVATAGTERDRLRQQEAALQLRLGEISQEAKRREEARLQLDAKLSELSESLRQANEEIVRRGEWGVKLEGEKARLDERLTVTGAERDQLRQQEAALQRRLGELTQEVAHREEVRLQLDAQLAELRRTLAERDAVIASASSENNRIAEQLATTGAERDQLRQQEATLQRRLDELTQDVAHREEARLKLDAKIAELSESLRQANEEIVRRGEWGVKLEGEKARLDERLTVTGAERDQLRQQEAALQHRLGGLTQEVAHREEARLQLDAQLTELRRTLAERNATIASASSENTRLGEQLSATGAERDQLRQQEAALQHRLGELIQEVAHREEARLQLDAQLADLRRTLAERDATIASANGENTRLGEQLTAVTERNSSLIFEQEQQLQSAQAHLTQLISSHEETRHQLASKLAELTESLRQANEEIVRRGEWGIKLNGEISHLREELAASQASLVRSSDVILENEQQLQAIQAQVAQCLDNEARALRHASTLETKISELSNSISSQEESVLRLKDKICRMETSFSWHVTKPIRAVRRLYQRITK
jgi:chromosome segregation ATPase